MNDVPIPTPRPAEAPQSTPTPPAATDPAAIGSGTPQQQQSTVDSIQSPSDQCIIIANGQQYKDWAQVEVTITQGQPMREGAFVATEVLDAPGLGFSLPTGQSALQLYPGMKVKIYMGGQLTLTGLIYERTANYDANKHSVLIKCSGDNHAIVRSAVAGKSGKAMKKATWEKYTNAQLAGAGLPSVKMNAKGKGATMPFDLIQHIPGEKRFKVIDRYARHAGIVMSESPSGRLVANDINPQGGGGGAELQEGKNILRASCKIWNEAFKTNRVGIGAYPNRNDAVANPRNNAQVATQSDSSGGGGAGTPSPTSPASGAGGQVAPIGQGGIGHQSFVPDRSGRLVKALMSGPSVSPMGTVDLGSSGDGGGGIQNVPGTDSPIAAAGPSASASSQNTTGATHAEVDTDNKHLQNRHDYQNMWEATNFEIQAEVVVRGWLKDDGSAWDVNTNGDGPQGSVSVNAPMLMLKQDLLINVVKLSQTADEGTLTTLTLGKYPTSNSPLPKQSDAKDGTPKSYPPDAPDPSTGANTGTQGGIDKSGGNPASGV